MRKFFIKCQLTAAIIISFILLNICGILAMYNNVIPREVSMTHPVIASLFEYLASAGDDDMDKYDETPITPFEPAKLPSEEDTGATQDNTTGQQETSSFDGDSLKTETVTDSVENMTGSNGNTASNYTPVNDKNYGKVVYTERISAAPRSPYYDEVNVKASSTRYNYSSVDKEYFSDTLFIGDSRIEGLCRYGGIDTASYCFKTGVTVWDVTKEQNMFDENFNKTSLASVLNAKNYEYIYMMIGINELGKGTPTSYANQYKEDIMYIRQYQPSAVIIIMGIMGVTKEYSDNSDVFNNDNINARNVAISNFSNGNDIFYIDMNDSICDSNGALIQEYSRDGIHLQAEYYSLWSDYICNHAVVK